MSKKTGGEKKLRKGKKTRESSFALGLAPEKSIPVKGEKGKNKTGPES